MMGIHQSQCPAQENQKKQPHAVARLATAIGRWVLTGAHLGGGSRTGHGSCRVRVAGAIRHDPTPGVHEVPGGTYIDIPGQPAEIVAARIYRSHLDERRERIAARLAGETL